MGKIIAVLNEKGGVAKTTTVKNLSVGLAAEGKKILAVDLDPSANLTTSVGCFKLEEDIPTILELFKLSEACEDIPESYGILKLDEGIDLIPSKKAFHDYEPLLNTAIQKEIVLRRLLATYKDKYDYIFLDCPAGLGIYVTNALFAADSLIIPVQPQFLGATAMMNLFGYVNKVRKLNGTGTKPDLMGILFTMVRMNTNNDMSLIKQFEEAYGERLFNTYITSSVRFSESDGEGMSIYKYAPKSSSAQVYRELTKEFMEMEEVANG